MQVQFKLTVGKNEFTLTENVESHTDFFKKMSFYSTLPRVGPNGEEDLIIQHRVAQKKYDYYSIVSPSAKMEFKFGQYLNGNGSMFAKGWEPLFEGSESQEEDNVPSSGLGAPTPAPAPTTKAAPTTGLGALKSQPTPTPVSADVQNNAKSVLAKYGL